MKKFTLLLSSILFSLGIFAQGNPKSSAEFQTDPGLRHCGQLDVLEKMQTEHPAEYQIYLQGREALEQETQNGFQPKTDVVYTIPVVFHVLHNGGAENISDAQIQDALNILNRDYSLMNADAATVYSTFTPVNIHIQFALAKIAPNGQCFNGITRTQNSATVSSNGQTQVNAVIAGNDVYQGVWPHNKYLNIIVAKDIGNGAAGYTFNPGTSATANATNMYYNSVFIRYDYTGSIGTSSEMTSRALTHEVGHWLNLSHTWGDDNQPGVACGDDYVSDTPITKGYSSCPSSPNNAKICNASIVENYENYMDYSYCSKMFTQGQKDRMRTCIVSSTAGRNNVWTEANLVATGVHENPNSLCGAFIQANPQGVCKGSSTTFSVQGIGTINSYSWTFPGGSPATSTAANPTVTYNNAGTYNVSVTITNSLGTRTITNTSFITVEQPVTTQSLPLTEGFTSSAFAPTGWSVVNGGQPETWIRSTSGTAPTTGNSAVVRFDSQNNPIGDRDDLNAPGLNMSGYSSSSLTFDVAYTPYYYQGQTLNDQLQVLVSPGCGLPYEVVYSKSGSTLQTEATTSTSYTNPTTWRHETVDLSAYAGKSQVRVMFRGISGWGNRAYIDNVNITGVASTPTAAFTPSATGTCVGNTVTFTDNSTLATSWNWNFGAGASPATATGQGPHTVTYSTAGTKTIKLIINGNASQITHNVTVSTVPTVTMNAITSTGKICKNASAVTLSGTPAGGTFSGTGVSGTQFNPASVSAGNHTITYTYSNNGCSNTDSKQITVNAIPTVTMNAITSDGTICSDAAAVSLSGTPAGGTFSGTGVSGSQFNPVTAGIGTYAVTYSYTDNNGCSNSNAKSITVKNCSTTGTFDLNSNEKVSYYPNPTNGNITFSHVGSYNSYSVIDYTGRTIMTAKTDGADELNIDFTNIANGVYIVQLNSASQTQRFKVEKH